MTGTSKTPRRPGAASASVGEGSMSLQAGPRAGESQPPAGTRTWRIELPAGQELLTSNTLGNSWGKRHRIGTAIKNDVIVLARAQKIPRLDRIAIVVEFQPPPGRRRVVKEAHNLGPSAKPAIDGLVAAGVIRDDADKYVAAVTFLPGPIHPGGRIVLHVIEEPPNQ